MSTDNIKVAVRVRPLLKHEVNAGHKTCLMVKPGAAQVHINGPTSTETFTYTYAFSPSQTDQDVYHAAVKPMIPSLFEGYNVTVLAYGQTGSGKTYSMGTSCGTDGGNTQGIIPKSVSDIFARIQSSKDADFIVSVSFLELYNEYIRDLLQNSTQPGSAPTHLEVREDPCLGVCIPGLSSIEVHSVDETLECLAKASQYRSTGATAMNKMSSRSHAIITLKIECVPCDGSQSTVAKFCLVDLAGSERVKKTQSTGQRFMEGVSINMGLLALGNVISALGDETQRQGYIPYRVSKLTRLLQDSLGGNSYTLMIACVSPSEYNAAESLNTLRYANRALQIKNKPVVNADIKAAEVDALKIQLAHLGKLLNLERTKSNNKRCPPGHQRLIDIVKSELNKNEDTPLINKIKASSPRTKTYLHEVGIHMDLEDEEPIEIAEVHGEDEVSPERLFPVLRDLKSPVCDEDEHDDFANEEFNYHEHVKNLGSELEKLEKEMQNKEAEVNKLVNFSMYDVEEKLTELQQQVNELQQEKQALEASLQELQRHSSKTQLAEQRRQQIKELEKRIAAQNKQLADLSRLRLEKKRDTDKINSLNCEIQNLKQARVRLSREMKKSADNFRQWKQRQDREVGRLQEAERKGRNKLDQQARVFATQQSVLQRKYQEAMAHVKRLQAQRRPQATTGAAQNAEKWEMWLDHELEVERSLAVTRDALDQLLAERSRLAQKVDEISTTKCWEDRIARKTRLNETRIIQSQITLQSNQITDLEQKLIGVEMGDSKSPHTRWAGINSLGDARLLLNCLFTKLINCETDLAARNERVVELEESQMNLKQQLKELQTKLDEKAEDKLAVQMMPPPPAVTKTPEGPSHEIRPKAVSSILKNRKSLFINPGLSDEESELDETLDSDNDPDWRLTPHLKQERGSREGYKKRSGSNENAKNINHRCSCKGTCSNKRCACVKSNEGCSENCRCPSSQCKNRMQSHEATFTIFNSTPNEENSSHLKRESSDNTSDFADGEIDASKKIKLSV